MIKAIVSVYNPIESVIDNIRGIAEQVDYVYICDNSSAPNEKLAALASETNRIVYSYFCENLGISAAFNRVLKHSDTQWKPDDYIFFFDQDSRIRESHIEQMILDYGQLLAQGHKVGCLGPAYFNTSSQIVELPRSKKALCEGIYSVGSVITSSMLCRYSDLQTIGFWNEDVFLDLADWDLCWRIAASGKLCCLTTNAVLYHSVGSGEKRVGLLRLRVGQPIREYYQIRDGMYLFLKKYAPWKFRLRYLAMLSIRSILHVIFFDHRKERLQYILRGFADACKKKKGVLN